ncbi:MAG: hypothetical protein Kow0080_33200 [Candidatus Promineifilaceae bacterium]
MLFRKQTHTNWLIFAILTFIALALFPYGWLAQHWHFFAHVVNTVFSTEVAHVVGHWLLFTIMGTAVLWLMPVRQWWLFVFVILALGLGQEILQLVTFKTRPFGLAELFDLAVDLAGAWTAWQVTSRYQTSITNH